MKKPSLLFWISLLLIFANACKKDKDSNPGIIGTWTVQQVQLDLTISGISQSDVDNGPTGTILFNANGTGEAAFYFMAFGMPYANIGPFTYTRNGNTVVVTGSSGDVQNWSILTETSTSIAAKWTEALDGGGEGTFQLSLAK